MSRPYIKTMQPLARGSVVAVMETVEFNLTRTPTHLKGGVRRSWSLTELPVSWRRYGDEYGPAVAACDGLTATRHYWPEYAVTESESVLRGGKYVTRIRVLNVTDAQCMFAA